MGELDSLRNTLSVAAPFVLSLFFLLMPLLIGALGGYKRALYWGIGNWLFLGIISLIWFLAGNAINDWLYNIYSGLFDESASKQSVMEVISIFSSIVFYIVILAIGNIILLICYYTFAKRMMSLTKDTKPKNVTKNYKIWSSIGGSLISFCMFFPVVADFSDATYIILSSESNLSKPENKYAQDFYNYNHFWHQINPLKIWDNSMNNLDGVSLLIGASQKDEEYIKTISSIFSRNLVMKIEATTAAIIAKETKDKFNAMSNYEIDKLETIFNADPAVDMLLSKALSKSVPKSCAEENFIKNINEFVQFYQPENTTKKIKISLHTNEMIIDFFLNQYVTEYSSSSPSKELVTCVESFVSCFFCI